MNVVFCGNIIDFYEPESFNINFHSISVTIILCHACNGSEKTTVLYIFKYVCGKTRGLQLNFTSKKPFGFASSISKQSLYSHRVTGNSSDRWKSKSAVQVSKTADFDFQPTFVLPAVETAILKSAGN